MLKVSSSLPDIAILRGGHKDFKKSLKAGGEVLSSLKRIGYSPVDVLIEKNGSWTVAGAPTDPHTIFVKAHTVIDTTEMRNAVYHDLAKKMGIPLHFSHQESHTVDREDVYRILRQHGEKAPETLVIRSKDSIKAELFRTIWTTFHTPILIRPISPHKEHSSKVVRIFTDLEASIRDYHERGIDTHILTYKNNAQLSSVAVLPSFRGEDIYMPLWVDVFEERHELPNIESTLVPHAQAPEIKKEKVKTFIERIVKTLPHKKPLVIDFITEKGELRVVNVDYYPSLTKEGRFMKSLSTTGVDIGQYIHNLIVKS
jgi:hypothetical protein